MDANAKKTALRMIPYGLYVLTAQNANGQVAAATVNWVTQVAFEPPLVVVGVKVDSHAHPADQRDEGVRAERPGQGPAGARLHVLQARRGQGRHHLRRAVPRRQHRGADPDECAGVRGVHARGDRGEGRPLRLRRARGRGRGDEGARGPSRRRHALAQGPRRQGLLRRLSAVDAPYDAGLGAILSTPRSSRAGRRGSPPKIRSSTGSSTSAAVSEANMPSVSSKPRP